MENAGCWNPALKDRRQPIPPVTILNQIYELDFKGFSYGFRPGRGPHQGVGRIERVNPWQAIEVGARCDSESFC